LLPDLSDSGQIPQGRAQRGWSRLRPTWWLQALSENRLRNSTPVRGEFTVTHGSRSRAKIWRRWPTTTSGGSGSRREPADELGRSSSKYRRPTGRQPARWAESCST